MTTNTKKKVTTKAAGSPAAATATAGELDPIYTAHQVHTLAHLTFQQLAASRWMPGASASYGTWPAQLGMMQGCAPHPSQVLLYWYP
jgi:hypothetical protein